MNSTMTVKDVASKLQPGTKIYLCDSGIAFAAVPRESVFLGKKFADREVQKIFVRNEKLCINIDTSSVFDEIA